MIEFWLHEYEDVLMEVLGRGEGGEEWEADFGVVGRRSPHNLGLGVGGGVAEEEPGSPVRFGQRGGPGAPGRDDRAWNALGEIMGEEEGISDSESVVSVGELGEEARLDEGVGPEGVFARQQRRRSTDNENTWEVS
jgi:hypothetical protein